MTIASTTNRISYTGNGSVSVYAYTFKIFTDDDLLVTVRDTAGTETTLTKTTDYTVDGVGETSGGNVTLVNASQAWLTGGNLTTNYVLVIRRVIDLLQSTDIRNQGQFYPEAHENAFDKFVMMSQQQQDELDRTMKNPETVPSSDFDPTLPSDIETANSTIIVNSSGNAFEMGPTASEISNAQTYANNASSSANKAENWATKTDGIVESTDYSSKAWSIGGTDVTDTASRGASKEWATKTSSTVDTSEFSSKEYAQGSQASTGGSSKNWAQQTGADVTGAAAGSMSSKEWAVGTLGRGVAGEGSSKDWATHTSGTVDDAEHSSKAWSVGGTGVTDTSGRGASKEWATKTSSTVDTSEFSSKEYAQGSQAGTGGSSKNWATQTGADVTGASAGDMSAKEWAVGTMGRGVANEGSSKDWATYTSGTVDGSEYSSKYHAQQASSSAASAALSAALRLFKQTDFLTSAGSPYTLTNSDLGILKSIDASSGNVVVNLPQISTLGEMAAIAFLRTDAGLNTVTINRAGTDTIGSGATSSITLDGQDHAAILAPEDSTTPDQWSHLNINSPVQQQRTVTTVTATTHNLADNDDILILDASSNAITVNLHAVASARVKPYTFIVKDNSNLITLDGNGSETIRGATTFLMHTNNQSVTLIPDGSAWYVDRHFAQTSWVDGGAITIGATTTAPTKAALPVNDRMRWRRDGKDLIADLIYNHTAGGVGGGSGDYTFKVVPTGYTIDTSIVTAYATVEGSGAWDCPASVVGSAAQGDSAAGGGSTGVAVLYDNTSVRIFLDTNVVGNAYAPMTQTTMSYSIQVRVPISGWEE